MKTSGGRGIAVSLLVGTVKWNLENCSAVTWTVGNTVRTEDTALAN